MANNWVRNHDVVYFYVKDPTRYTFNRALVPHPPGYRRRDGRPPKANGVPIEDVWNASEADQALRGAASLDSTDFLHLERIDDNHVVAVEIRHQHVLAIRRRDEVVVEGMDQLVEVRFHQSVIDL